MLQVPATRFKAQCLALLDDVAESGSELVITKRGRPVAKVVPVDDEGSLRGSVEFNATDEELIAPLGERWDAEG